jgi:hypothetical protein
MTEAYEFIDHTYDVVIAGGAGMRAALGMQGRGRGRKAEAGFE